MAGRVYLYYIKVLVLLMVVSHRTSLGIEVPDSSPSMARKTCTSIRRRQPRDWLLADPFDVYPNTLAWAHFLDQFKAVHSLFSRQLLAGDNAGNPLLQRSARFWAIIRLSRRCCSCLASLPGRASRSASETVR